MIPGGGKTVHFARVRAFAAAVVVSVAVVASAQSGTVLKPADLQKLLPATVYYKGQSAPVQLRNSSGVKFADGYNVLAAMVDTSGYSSDVSAKYQAYFITEVTVKLGGQVLAAGIYGAGIAGGKFVLTDVGGHDVLTSPMATDDATKHPVPLQFISTGGGYRLYLGRQFVTLSR
jgi:hypothetical protein